MTRDDVSAMIRWPILFAIIGIINPLFMVPQIVSIVTTGVTDGVSLVMLSLLTIVQAGVVGEGFFNRRATLMWSNAAATTVTVLTALAVIYYRS